MSLEGNLKEFDLPDIFNLITMTKKTGFLQIRRTDAEGRVYFKEGEVYFAISNWNRSSLGQRLIQEKKITEEELERAVMLQKNKEKAKRLGEILVSEKFISRNELTTFIQKQILDTVFDLFRWETGDFEFLAGEVAEKEDIGVSLSTENIIMEASRRIKEWERIKHKIPSLEIVFRMAEAPGEGERDILLKPGEWKLLRLIDGSRDINSFIRILGMSDFEVCKIIYGLFSVGLLEIISGG
ncbi:MAG: DUF4388 domain-containing protein [Actinomycetia bacterium]|nr:DUF4388 domain-containing protein [Actinomycetes bacterium]